MKDLTDGVDQVRGKLLAAIVSHGCKPDEKSAACARNWATAYGILTDKQMMGAA